MNWLSRRLSEQRARIVAISKIFCFLKTREFIAWCTKTEFRGTFSECVLTDSLRTVANTSPWLFSKKALTNRRFYRVLACRNKFTANYDKFTTKVTSIHELPLAPVSGCYSMPLLRRSQTHGKETSNDSAGLFRASVPFWGFRISMYGVLVGYYRACKYNYGYHSFSIV